MSAELNGRKVLVTGGASGIGAACAAAFAAAGAAVTVADLDERGARKVAEPLGGTAVGVDLADRAFDAAALAGGMDVIVNNAGIQHVAPIESFPDEKWDAIIAINLSSAFHLSKAVIPGMKARRFGRIVNIASAHGLTASPFKAAYVSAKHGIIGLSKTIALEVAEHGITANTICPGYVKTPLVDKQIADQAKAHGISEADVVRDVMLVHQARKEFVRVDELAALAVFLASDAAASMTATAIAMDGGWTQH
jgi:3-hydroxybutyrate dehydrogenase